MYLYGMKGYLLGTEHSPNLYINVAIGKLYIKQAIVVCKPWHSTTKYISQVFQTSC